MDAHDFNLFATDIREETEADRTLARFRIHVKDVETEGIETTLDLSALWAQLDTWTDSRPIWSDVIAVGTLLGDALFPPGRIREALRESLVKPRRGESRLRVTLNLGALNKYPWEFAVVPIEKGETTPHDILALNSQVSLIRLVDLAPSGPSQLAPASLPLQMVVAMANPKGSRPLKLDREKAILHQSLDSSKRVAVTYVDAAQRQNLLGGVGHPHLFHFAGHGSFAERPSAGATSGEGYLWLQDEHGGVDAVDAAALALQLGAAGVRVAVLGACLTARHDDLHVWSSIATSLLKAGVGAIVAMQYSIEDATAIAFAKAFYEALAVGFPIDQAVTKGRLAIGELSDARGMGTPVLYMRPSDGLLFPELTENPALAAERQATHVTVKVSADLVDGQLTGIRVSSMTGGNAEAAFDVRHVAAGGHLVGFQAGSLTGGSVHVRHNLGTVSGDVVGVSIGNIVSGSVIGHRLEELPFDDDDRSTTT